MNNITQFCTLYYAVVVPHTFTSCITSSYCRMGHPLNISAENLLTLWVYILYFLRINIQYSRSSLSESILFIPLFIFLFYCLYLIILAHRIYIQHLTSQYLYNFPNFVYHKSKTHNLALFKLFLIIFYIKNVCAYYTQNHILM